MCLDCEELAQFCVMRFWTRDGGINTGYKQTTLHSKHLQIQPPRGTCLRDEMQHRLDVRIMKEEQYVMTTIPKRSRMLITQCACSFSELSVKQLIFHLNIQDLLLLASIEAKSKHSRPPRPLKYLAGLNNVFYKNKLILKSFPQSLMGTVLNEIAAKWAQHVKGIVWNPSDDEHEREQDEQSHGDY
ncbi:hypothetical protein J1614_002617 [Plenodomus biglobosus]|nr:hypothetical protein J1614_002617 [Plenodomus biglobosus]